MTGRMYITGTSEPLPKHAAVVLELDQNRFVFEDTRYFGRLTLDTTCIKRLGPEPLSRDFLPQNLVVALRKSSQPIKVKLLDQTCLAGVGNIYASEALFHAGISPLTSANRLTKNQVRRLWQAVRNVLATAIEKGSTVPLDFGGENRADNLFYYGRSGDVEGYYDEGLCVYDREGLECVRCSGRIRKLIQAARSTYFCPKCQKLKN
jgi:formamidopyrimidine-DNA glycosylase